MEFNELIDTKYRQYANYDNLRKLANYIDGLKISSRKAIFTATKITAEKIKVVGLASKTVEIANYHHGEVSMEGVIVSLAQNFVGSNNVNLLTPLGQFGNILDKNASSSRYIHTRLDENFNRYFKKDDLDIVEYEFDEGSYIQPKIYYPILPLILINGAEGIGNGYSSFIMSYNEKQIKEEILNYLTTSKINRLKPYIAGYKGLIEKDATTGQILIKGVIKRVNTTRIDITEVPVKYDLEKYQAVLNKLVANGVIKDYDDLSNEEGWNISLSVSREFSSDTDENILETLGLVQRNTETLVVLDENSNIRVYETVEDILKDWIDFRLGIYNRRKDNLLSNLNDKSSYLHMKAKFIEAWNSDAGLIKMSKKQLQEKLKSILPEATESDIDKLLALRISSLTLDSVKELEKDIKEIEKSIKKISKMKNIDFMKEDLGA